MSRKQERSNGVRKLAAAAMVIALVALIVAASIQFLGGFKSTKPITVVAPRAGLVMNPDAKVKLRGVEVGRVDSITQKDGHAVLTLNISSDQLRMIPANVTADIKSNTIFGAKAVNFDVPASGPVGTLSAGAVIDADHVVVELNTVYQKLVAVLAKLQPEKLNATIGALNTALDGNGDNIGRGLAGLSTLLAKTNPHLPELNELFEQAASATNIYADVMPDLLRTVDNTIFLGNTLVDNTSNLDALLVNTTGMANTIDGILAPRKAQIIKMLSNLNPTATLLGYQAPGLRCFITATAAAGQMAAPIFGLNDGQLKLNAGLLPGKEPYRYPYNLPENNADGPPTCEGGLSNPRPKKKADFYVTDNAPQPYQPRTTPKFNSKKVFQLLFGAPPRG
ncbi:Mce family protein [Gordonia effusa NBRC 100432]|uniref:Mce family protein n=1 Tax=Gordonia effusa NBRC 100432 TaxID=1077974 RepID=H0QV80_9ACTN|nr:MCE family protein [Gordonia effusa]GAB16731.1 Mce family protein [Gordonia effusa NBRC 100432]